MSIPKHLKQLRESAGLTQAEAAERVGLTRQAISSYESGRTRPDVEMLMKLSEVYGTDLDAVLYGQSDEQRKLRRVRVFAVGFLCVLLGLVLVDSLLLFLANAVFPLKGGFVSEDMRPVVDAHFAMLRLWTVLQGITYGLARVGSIVLAILLIMLKRLPPLKERLLWFGILAAGGLSVPLLLAALDPVHAAIDYLMLPLWLNSPLVLLFLFSLALGWWKNRAHS